MKGALTPRQQEVYDLILVAARRGQSCPTLREMGEVLGIKSTNAVACHIDALVAKGWVRRGEKGISRSLRPTVKVKLDLVEQLAKVTLERDEALKRVHELAAQVDQLAERLVAATDP